MYWFHAYTGCCKIELPPVFFLHKKYIIKTKMFKISYNSITSVISSVLNQLPDPPGHALVAPTQ